MTHLRAVLAKKCSRSTTKLLRRPFWSKSNAESQLYSEQRLLGYSCQQMFNVVSEVERYHSFVPWCKQSLIKHRSEDKLVADLIVGFPPLFGESYTSTVTLIEPYLVTAVCTDMSMFNHLKTVWKFRPTEGDDINSKKCQLDFAVSFAFRSNAHSYFSRLFFDEVIRKNVEAFLSQAELRYGRESMPRQRPVIYAKH